MMTARTYQVRITGASPMLCHQDNLEWQEKCAAWKNVPENKKLTKAGDDRVPAWTWLGYAYHDNKTLVVPADNLMTVLREGGAKVLVPGGKLGKTFKAQSQSGLVIDQAAWPLEVAGHVVPWAPFAALVDCPDFELHQVAASEAGFSLFVKRAAIGQSKHVRVRPRFDSWAIAGTVTVFDEQITAAALANILTAAGQYCELGDWRPSSKTPGPWGRFTATCKEA